MLQAQVLISEIADRLTAHIGRWVTNAAPKEPEGGWITFDLSREEFLLAQRIISGAELGASIEASLSFLEAREERLSGEANEGQAYCSSGWIEDGDSLWLWYETTSGTMLGHAFDADNELFQILLPQSRAMGKHHMELSRVKAGMNGDQYDRWYNSNCLGDDKILDYAEWAVFHNTHMVLLGWEPMITGEQLALQRQLNSALHYVHGEWAQEYGIGTSLSSLMGYGDAFFRCESKPAPTLKGQKRLEAAASVLRQLQSATTKWRALMAEWGEETQVEIEDYEDYEGSEEDFNYEDA